MQVKPIVSHKSTSSTFTPKQPLRPKNWRGHLLGVCYTFQKLDRVLGLQEKQLQFLLAAEQDAWQKAQVSR